MTGKADAALSCLFSSAAALNAVTDEITSEIKDLEAALAAQGIGVQAWVTVDEWTEERDGYLFEYSAAIGYGKHNGKWGLLYEVWCEQFGDSQICFLRDTAREIRIGALEKLPELFDKLAEEADKLRDKATKNLSDAKDIAAALKKSGRK